MSPGGSFEDYGGDVNVVDMDPAYLTDINPTHGSQSGGMLGGMGVAPQAEADPYGIYGVQGTSRVPTSSQPSNFWGSVGSAFSADNINAFGQAVKGGVDMWGNAQTAPLQAQLNDMAKVEAAQRAQYNARLQAAGMPMMMAPPMSATTKVLIGVAVLAAAGGLWWYFKKRKGH